MASGDMIAKLLLDSKDFSNKIGKANSDVQSFGDKGAAAADSMMAAFGKIAGVIAGAIASVQAFEKVIASSQALTDEWGRTVESVNSVLDNFVYGLANADFTSFSLGLDNLIQKAREMYDAYDQLANTIMSANFTTTLDQARYKELMVIAKDKSRTEEERQAAFVEMQSLAGNITEAAKKVERDSYAALSAMFASKSGANASLFTPAMMEEAFRIDARFTSNKERERIMREYEQYKRETSETDKLYYLETGERVYGSSITGEMGGPQGHWVGDKAVQEAERMRIQGKYAKTLVEYIALMRLQDEDLQQAMNTYVNAVQQRNVVSKMTGRMNESRDTFNAEINTTRRKKKEDELFLGDPFRYDLTAKAGISFDNSHLPLINFVGPRAMKRYKKAEAFDPEQDKLARIKDTSYFDEIAKKATELADPMNGYAEGIETVSSSLSFLNDVCLQLGAASDSTAMKVLSMIQAFVGVLDALKPGLNMGLGGVLGIFSSALPKFATGGIVTAPTIGLVGEAGSEAIIPLDRLNSMMQPRELRVSGRITGSGKDLSVIIDNYNRVRRVQ